MIDNKLVLAMDKFYSLDTYETKVNNNVLVVGASGSGKTRSIVEPNLLQATGSYIVSDPKGNLYRKYKSYLESKDYRVLKLDFTDPLNSAHYNFFNYIRNTVDIVKVAHTLIYQGGTSHVDPFWDQSAQLLVQSIMAYLIEFSREDARTLSNILHLLSLCDVKEEDSSMDSPLDLLMKEGERVNPSSYAVKTYKKFRVGAGKTCKSILITANTKLGLFDIPELNSMMKTDDVMIPTIGDRKTALFVVVSDTDRSMDNLANIFFTQAMNELCRHADKECHDEHLPIPVRFILDDFATNVRITDFPRTISSIRSRWISTMLMIQAESQLDAAYQDEGNTIIGNCDTYVYLGGNDLETAKSVAERCNMPYRKILNMPVGTNWIFRRGQEPVNSVNMDLGKFKMLKVLGRPELVN